MRLKRFTDPLQREIEIPFPPQKIISLVPSITELLCDLGLETQLTGVTKFCVRPDHIRSTKKIIGGTKNIRIEQIKNLEADLIIANKEENVQSQIAELALTHPVWICDVSTFDEAIEMILQIGNITNTSVNANTIIGRILTAKTKFEKKISSTSIKTKNAFSDGQPVEGNTLYLIWRKPYMSVGGDTFISNMMAIAGYQNCLQGRFRYPELHAEEIAALHPKEIFLSSEPYPFSKKHLEELHTVCPGASIRLVDGEMFSWYGSRMVHAFDYFTDLHQ